MYYTLLYNNLLNVNVKSFWPWTERTTNVDFITAEFMWGAVTPGASGNRIILFIRRGQNLKTLSTRINR